MQSSSICLEAMKRTTKKRYTGQPVIGPSTETRTSQIRDYSATPHLNSGAPLTYYT